MFLNKLKKIFKAYKKYGAIKFLYIVFFELLFDFFYSLDTKIFIKSHISLEYQPSNVLYLKYIINNLPFERHKVVLLDYGSGKGRILCYALLKGIRQVIGIEFNKHLAAISLNNLEKLNFPVTKYTVFIQDAAKFHIFSSVNVIVLFNPFQYNTLQKVFSNIIKRASRSIIYIFILNQIVPPPAEFCLIKSFKYNCYLYCIKPS